MVSQPTHAAPRGSVPPKRRIPKPLRTALSVGVAATFGLGSAVMVGSPAMAANGAVTLASPTVAVAEGAGSATITVNRASDAGTQTSRVLTWTTTNGTAKSPGDYTGTQSGTATLPALAALTGDTYAIVIPIVNDTTYETAEAFTVAVTVDGSTNVGTATVTINPDADAPPSYTLTASPASVSEATVGAHSTITATLNALSGVDTVVTFNTINGTAVAGTSPLGDYTAVVNQPMTIAAGFLSTSIDVAVTADGIKDTLDTEDFVVSASATNVATSTVTTPVSIVDAQSTPVLTLTGGGTVAEGDTMHFVVTVAPGSEKAITVQWDAVAAPVVAGQDAATSGTDFPYSSPRTITIPAKTLTAPIDIPITDDNVNELTENFKVQLSNPTNATLGTSSVVGMITDNDTAPVLTITPTAVTEGDTGTSTKTFTATLSAASGRTITAGWRTFADGIAVGDAQPVKDFIEKSGTLTFPAGSTTQTFTVDVVGDTIDEGSGTTPVATDGEIFDIALSGQGSPVSFSNVLQQLKITDDDAAPTISFDDVTMPEGNSATPVLLPVKLTGSSDKLLTFTIADTTTTNTPNGTATAALVNGAVGSDDYDLLNTSVVIPPEMTSGYAVVLVNGDAVHEEDETAYFSATDATVGDITAPTTKTAKLTLTNDDKAPNLEINSITGNEGDTVDVTGTVSGVSDDMTWVSVVFAGGSSHGSKAADANDFTNPGAQVVQIWPGTTPGYILPVGSIVLANDTIAEPAETIIGSGFGLANVGTVTEGIVTIAASDGGSGGGPGTGPVPTINVPAVINGVGTVQITGTAGVTGTDVNLWGAPFGSDPEYIATIQAQAGGAYAFGMRIGSGYHFLVKSNGHDSATKEVWIQTLVAFSTSAGKGNIGLSVTANPIVMGSLVSYQILNAHGSYTTLASGPLDASGHVVRYISGLRSGSTYSTRAVIAGSTSKGTLLGISAVKKVTVK